MLKTCLTSCTNIARPLPLPTIATPGIRRVGNLNQGPLTMEDTVVAAAAAVLTIGRGTSEGAQHFQDGSETPMASHPDLQHD